MFTTAMLLSPAAPAWSGLRRFCLAHQRLAVAVLLLTWTCIVRLPFVHVLHDDEAFFSIVASRWLRGDMPYATSFDVKAPGIFAVLAVIQMVFGAGLYVIKATEIAFTALGAYGLYAMMARWGSRRSAAWAGFLYPLYSLTFMSLVGPCQIVQAAATIWAFCWAAETATAASAAHRVRAAALSGLMIGCAVTLKQTAAFEGAGLFAWIVWQTWRRREGLPLLAFVVAGAAPTLAFVAVYAVFGHLRELYVDTVLMAYQRSQLILNLKPGPWYVEFPQRIGILLMLMLPVLAMTGGVLLAVVRRARLRQAVGAVIIDLGLIWYASALAGLVVNREPSPWYITTLIAPGLLLLCLLLCEGISWPQPRGRFWTAVFTLAIAGQTLIGVPQSLSGPRTQPDYRGVVLASEALKARGVRPGDDLLVLSRGHYINIMTQTLPRAPYFNAMHLLCDFPLPEKDPVAADFATHPRYVVLSDPGMGISCTKLSHMRDMQRRLARDYTLMTTVHGSWDSFLLYRRNGPQQGSLDTKR